MLNRAELSRALAVIGMPQEAWADTFAALGCDESEVGSVTQAQPLQPTAAERDRRGSEEKCG